MILLLLNVKMIIIASVDRTSESDSENSPEHDLSDTASQKSSDEQETEASSKTKKIKTQDDKEEKESI